MPMSYCASKSGCDDYCIYSSRHALQTIYIYKYGFKTVAYENVPFAACVYALLVLLLYFLVFYTSDSAGLGSQSFVTPVCFLLWSSASTFQQ